MKIRQAGPDDYCSACGHLIVEHDLATWHCLVDIIGLNNEWRQCTCTFVRIAGRSAADA